jgi:hypothetical protein
VSDDLVTFLRARIAEDEAAVQVVLGVNVMAGIKHGKPVPRWVPSPKGDAGVWDTDGIPRVKFAWARERDHIVRHDPARVLREIEAKRRIVDRYAWLREHGDAGDAAWVLPLLAAAYADHPDYRPEWAPAA